MRKITAVVILLFLPLTISCATLIPQAETVIRLPQEHEYARHSGRIPIIYIHTFPLEYWDFSLSFKTAEANALLLAGEALMATLKEGLGTVFKPTQRARSGDFRAVIDLNQFSFEYRPMVDGRMEFQASMNVAIIDGADRKIDEIHLHASTISPLPDGEAGQLKTALNSVAELLSMMEKDIASHALKSWDEGRYAVF